MATRLKKLQNELKKRSLDGLVVTHLPDIRYLSGFSGSTATMLVTPGKVCFFTDFRYQGQVEQELAKGITVFIDRAHYDVMVREKLVQPGMEIGFQDQYVTVAGYEVLKKKFKKVSLKKVGGLLREFTMVKSEEEIAWIKKAGGMASKVFKNILEIAKPGVREIEVAMEISYLGKKFGSEGDAFDIIVASGPRGALPHGRASTKKIRKGELVTLDFGCIHNGFNSDLTRTFAVGEPSDEAKKVYDIVYKAERAGVRAASAGMTGKELDDVCRDIIKGEGYGDAFGHSTGHGLGIEVHETPHVAASGHEQMLVKGMVVTIEPGIYLPGKCGVRIEDDVAIGADGCTVLTSAPRKLIVV